jgi:hypothetical protein
MQYWIKMTEDELRVAMLLLGRTELDGVTEVREGFDASRPLLEGMLRKGFFEERPTGRGWTPFAETVLRCALQAQSRLRVDSASGALCCLYFRYDNMVLLSRKPEEEALTLYYVPLLPEAIGSLARELKTAELAVCRPAALEERSLQVSAPESAADLLPALRAAQPDAAPADARPLLLADGLRFGLHSLSAALLGAAQGSLRVGAEGDGLRVAPAGYYDFLESISHWIVATHGASIASKEGEQ